MADDQQPQQPAATPRKNWVHFDEAAPNGDPLQAPPTQTTSTTGNGQPAPPPQEEKTASVTVSVEAVSLPSPTRPINASIRTGFSNGDVVVTLLPVNTRWPWITAAKFRPELVPEELMAQGLTLTVEEYVQAMELLVNDYRFTLYNVCYKRVLVCWIALAFTVLMALLFSGLVGLILFSLGVVWLLLNAGAIFICMWIKLRLSKGLEKCLGRVNKQLMKHKLLLTLDDRGKMSCHKVTLCFMYFDSAPCIAQLQQIIERDEGSSIPVGWERRLDVTSNDIIIQGAQTTRLSRKQERAAGLYLRYLARWANRCLRGKHNVSPLQPGRHSHVFNCPCQYIEEHLLCKPPKGLLQFCPSDYHTSSYPTIV